VVVPEFDPYTSLIEQFITQQFPNVVTKSKQNVLDLITAEIVATNQVRCGPVPSPEALVRFREVISYWMEKDLPIPFLVPWGSEKPNGTGIDLAELWGLRTLTSLQDRVSRVFTPGVRLNIRIENASAPHLFYHRPEEARKEADKYTQGFVRLIDILDLLSFIKPVPESTLISEEAFNKEADKYLPAMFGHVQFPDKELHIKELAEFGWKPVSHSTISFYVECFEKLYVEIDRTETLYRLARYFSGALARKNLKLSGAEPEWEGRNLDISFLKCPPGINPSLFTKRVYYRTLPSRITNNHIPPWRAKGYLRFRENNVVSAGLASFQTPAEYNELHIRFERGDKRQLVQSDYLVM
jgi:hypothetical protein